MLTIYKFIKLLLQLIEATKSVKAYIESERIRKAKKEISESAKKYEESENIKDKLREANNMSDTLGKFTNK